MLIGHIAISLLEHRYLKADLAPVLIAGMAPDILDKTLCQVLHLTPSGRMYGHTLLGLALSTGLVALLWGRRTAWSWALGYLSHLVADGAGVPWLYPFVHYDFNPSPGLWENFLRYLSSPLKLLPELFLCLWAGLTAVPSRFPIPKIGSGKNRNLSSTDKTEFNGIFFR